MPATESELVRAHMWVTGRVQNVGFRAHVEYTALRVGITGWVRNVGNDKVEAVAEGTRVELEHFLATVGTGTRGSRVDETKIEWENPTGEYRTFEVRPSL